jgi:multiple inositol-polyphosphate phosphatase/2,3-bisphosphoglycerate 3-phosphatase
MFEYYEDLSNYYKKGYGIAVNYEIATTLLNDFFSVMENVMTGNTSETATLRFAHAETMMPFVSLLGLFEDSSPLLWNSSQETIDNRLWRTSIVSPFAANVIFELYNCTGEFKVKLLHNEQEYGFPECNDLYCPFTTLQTLYTKQLGYNFNALCGVESTACSASSDNDVKPGMVAVTAVGTFLVGGVVASAGTWMVVTKKNQKKYSTYTLMS